MFGPGPNSVVIPPTGQDFSIVITAPPDGTELIVPPGDVLVEGQVTIGGIAGGETNILYVVDVSGSTATNVGDCDGDGFANLAGDDFNGDGTLGDVLDCEISGVIALNESLFGTVNVDGGLVPFGSLAAVGDVGPAAGQQDFTSPLDADLGGGVGPDLEEVARSLDQGEVNLFTFFFVSTGTNFNNAITSLNAAFAGEPAGENNVAFFLSDGFGSLSTVPGSPLDLAAAAGTVINTFSVGPFASGCDPGDDLKTIADTTGGTCTVVLDPTDLSSALPGLTPTLLDRVEVNGVVVPTDALGNFSTTVVCPSPTEDNFVVTATGFADDPPDLTTVSADIMLTCKPANNPPVADAGEDQVVECTSPAGADVTLDGTGSFDPDGDPITFDWTNAFGLATGETPTVSLALGAHNISLLVEDDQGASDTDEVIVTVEDTTGPTLVASLTPICGHDDDDEGQQFLVGLQCSDVCDANPNVTGAIEGTPVGDGDVFVILGDDDDEDSDDNGLNQLTLDGTCSDASGNTVDASVTVLLGEPDDDSDSDSDD